MGQVVASRPRPALGAIHRFLYGGSIHRQRQVWFYLMISPWLAGFVLWQAGPMLAALGLSLTQYDALAAPRFVGVQNYVEMFGDRLTWQALKVTAIYTAGAVALVLVGSLLLATLLNQRLPLLGVWRTVFYLPVVTSGVAVALLWSWLLQPDFGLVNVILYDLFRIRGPEWFFSDTWVLPSFMLMAVWGVGGPMLIYLAAMQGVPTQLYEAATIDAFAVGALFPVFWMITTSLKPGGDVFLVPPKWLPNPIVWKNYPEALAFMDAVDVFRNSFLVSFLSVVGVTASSSLVAFPFARLRVRGSNVLFILVLSTLLLPSQVTLIPKFLLFKQIGWIDTLNPLWVPSFFGTPYAIFLLRQFFRTIPPEIDEAAIIDGCSIFGLFWRIIVPLSLPALGVVAIQHFIFSWEWFLEPLIYLNSSANFTVAVALAKFQVSYGGTPWHLLMAASTVALIPPVALFFVTQRFFIQGVVISGVKG